MKIFCFVLVLFVLASPTAVFGDDPAYDVPQDEAIAFFENFASDLKGFKAGSTKHIPSPSENAIHHLTGVYLYCSIKKGICPFILDGILEIDVINSRLSGKAACPVMTAFWKKWIANGFEKRRAYNISTGHLKRYMDFKKKDRPKYIRCRETIEKEIAPKITNDEFFKKRYANDSPVPLKVSNTALFLKEIKEKVSNVFVSTGAYKAH